MPAYAIFIVTKIKDPLVLEEYRKLGRAIVGAHGGKPVIRPTSNKSLVEGGGVEDLIIIEFPTLEAARNWYESPEYKAASVIRQRACDCNVILSDGV